MLQQAIVTTVDYCTRYARQVVGIAILLGLVTGIYAAGHFAIDADVNKLISKDLPWRQREAAFNKFFPSQEETMLAVVDAPTSEQATQATAVLIQRLSNQKDHFHSIAEGGGGPFFQKNGLLFLPTEEVLGFTKKLGEAKPVIQVLAQDSNLRGLTTALNYGLVGARMNHYTLDDFGGTMNMVSDTLDDAIAGRPASFSWRAMLNGRPSTTSERRRFIEIRPVLDFTALMPGKAATDAIRSAASDLATQYGARVRLTGPVAIADEEYATLQEGAFVNTTLTIVVVLTILWLALRSFGIILAVFISLLVGLSITAAIGLALVGALNLISVAFAVLFIGLGVDFGIQFSVRYRAERHEIDDLHEALIRTARYAGAPLTLAAAATAAGFLSFLPTDYKGLSELGLLAGLGMIIAFVTSITVIPALLMLLRPPGEPEGMGFTFLAPLDRAMERHRIPIIVCTGLVVAAGLPLLYWLQFDFNPLNLRSPKVELVATFLELRSDPAIGASSIYVLVPNEAAVKAAAEKLSKLPEVSSVKTVESFIPADQQPKLAAIRQLATVLEPALRPDPNKKPPTDADNVAALKAAVANLKQAAGTQTGRGGIAANRLADDLTKLADGDEALRARAQAAMIPPLQTALDELRGYLHAEPVTLQTLPTDITERWVTKDGQYKVEILPKGDPTDNETLRRIRARGAGGRAEFHRRPDCDFGIRSYRDSRVLRSRVLGARLDHHSALDRAAPLRRRPADHHPAADGRHRDHGADGPVRHEAQFREHHRVAVAPRRRGRLQDLLHHGVASGPDRPAAIQPDACGDVQCGHHCDRLRQLVAVEPSRYVEHGQADGACARHHHGRGRAVPTAADGAAAREGQDQDAARAGTQARAGASTGAAAGTTAADVSAMRFLR